MNWRNTSSPASAPTMAKLLEIMRSIPPRSRDVFYFDGTNNEFFAVLESHGVERKQPDPSMPPLSYSDRLFGGIDVWEFDGKTWAGDIRDVEAARKGELPYKTIGRPVDRLPIVMLTDLA